MLEILGIVFNKARDSRQSLPRDYPNMAIIFLTPSIVMSTDHNNSGLIMSYLKKIKQTNQGI